MENQTIITEFILLGLSSDPHLQVFFFVLFLLIFAMTLLGNAAIILVIQMDARLQCPMFFFLSHLALVDICFSSVILPKMLESLIAPNKTISQKGCIVQTFFLFQFGGAEAFILSMMAYDRYVAICDALHYSTIMKKTVCRKLLGGAWSIGFFHAMVNSLPLVNAHFCGNNTIRHFSCELPSLLPLSCSDPLPYYVVLVTSLGVFGLSTCLFTLVSYIYIISAILKICSEEGRSKAFSTCSSHLIVVGLYYSTGLFRYMKPRSESLIDLDKVVSIQYSILTPLLNPIIYSLKNNEIKTPLGKIFGNVRVFLLNETLRMQRAERN